jgi:hypothetical protein
MKGLLVALVVVVVAVCALGFWQGWFEVGGRKDEGKAQASLKVDLKKFKEDKDHFKRALGDKAKSMKEKLVGLKDKAKHATGEAKAAVEKEIASLTKKHESIESKMKEVEDSTDQNFEGLKKSLAEYVEPETDRAKEASDRPK